MAKSLSHQKIKPFSGQGTGDGLFSFILVLAPLLLITVSPASAYPLRYIPAKAAIVIDPKKEVVYSKNQDAKLPPASTTKLVTAMVVLDHLKPESRVKISPYAARVHSIQPRLRPYEELNVSDLLHLALMKSSNSSAAALAEGVAGSEEGFAEMMNKKAQDIGALNTRFANASGLPEGEQYTTVYDLTLIMNEALKYPLIKEILGKKECVIVTPEGRSLALRSTNKLLWASENMIGGKTGYTGAAQHCFVGAYQTENGPVYTAVLGTTSRYRLWKSTELLLNMGAGPQSIPSIRLAYERGGKAVKGKKHYVKSGKSRRAKYLSKKKRSIRVVRKTNTSSSPPNRT